MAIVYIELIPKFSLIIHVWGMKKSSCHVILCIANFWSTLKNWVTITKAVAYELSDVSWGKTFATIFGSCEMGSTVHSLESGCIFFFVVPRVFYRTFCVSSSSENVLFSFNELICMFIFIATAGVVRERICWFSQNCQQFTLYKCISIHGKYGDVHSIISLRTHKFKLKKNFFFSFVCLARIVTLTISFSFVHQFPGESN